MVHVITKEEAVQYRRNNFVRLCKEDLDPHQKIDWADTLQQYCFKHKRNYHFKCMGCFP